MNQSVMLGDLLATGTAFILFAPILLIPGLLAGWASDAFGFRDAHLKDRLASGVLLGVAVSPALVYLITRFGSFPILWVVYGCAGLIFVVRARTIFPTAQASGVFRALGQSGSTFALIAWIVLAYVMVADVQTSNGLAINGMTFDKLSHTAVTDAITRTGVPPINPFFQPNEPIPLFYYYFWYLMCSVVDQLGGDLVTARAAQQAGTIWGGIVLITTVATAIRWQSRGTGTSLAIGAGLALLLVTGLDLIPTFALAIIKLATGSGPGLMGDMEWWNEQVPSWLTSMLWVPHHVAGFAAALTGFMILRHLADADTTRRQSLAQVTLAGLAFASALGLSVWVTLVAAAIAAVWVIDRMRMRAPKEAALFVAAGTIALLIALPFLIDLMAANQRTSLPVRLEVREFFPLTRLDMWFGFADPCGPLCRLLVLPVNYALELGLFALTGVLYWRARRGRILPTDERFLVVMAGVSLVMCSFVRSNLDNNDLGWRGLLFAQLALLIWAIPVLERGFRKSTFTRRLIAFALVIGVMGTLGQAVRLRVHPASEHSLALRQTYEWIGRNTPSDTKIQPNPATPYNVFAGLFSNRQAALFDQNSGPLFGIMPAAFRSLDDELGAIFGGELGPNDISRLARRHKIDIIIITSDDPIWRQKDAWVWTTKILFSTRSTRVIAVDDLITDR